MRTVRSFRASVCSAHAGLCRTLEKKQKILQAKVDPTRSGVERVMLAPQDKQEVLKLTQEIRFAIEIAMVSLLRWYL